MIRKNADQNGVINVSLKKKKQLLLSSLISVTQADCTVGSY